MATATAAAVLLDQDEEFLWYYNRKDKIRNFKFDLIKLYINDKESILKGEEEELVEALGSLSIKSEEIVFDVSLMQKYGIYLQHLINKPKSTVVIDLPNRFSQYLFSKYDQIKEDDKTLFLNNDITILYNYLFKDIDMSNYNTDAKSMLILLSKSENIDNKIPMILFRWKTWKERKEKIWNEIAYKDEIRRIAISIKDNIILYYDQLLITQILERKWKNKILFDKNMILDKIRELIDEYDNNNTYHMLNLKLDCTINLNDEKKEDFRNKLFETIKKTNAAISDYKKKAVKLTTLNAFTDILQSLSNKTYNTVFEFHKNEKQKISNAWDDFLKNEKIDVEDAAKTFDLNKKSEDEFKSYPLDIASYNKIGNTKLSETFLGIDLKYYEILEEKGVAYLQSDNTLYISTKTDTPYYLRYHPKNTKYYLGIVIRPDKLNMIVLDKLMPEYPKNLIKLSKYNKNTNISKNFEMLLSVWMAMMFFEYDNNEIIKNNKYVDTGVADMLFHFFPFDKIKGSNVTMNVILLKDFYYANNWPQMK